MKTFLCNAIHTNTDNKHHRVINMTKMSKAKREETLKKKFPVFYEQVQDLKYTIGAMIDELEDRIEQMEDLQEKIDDVEQMKSDMNIN